MQVQECDNLWALGGVALVPNVKKRDVISRLGYAGLVRKGPRSPAAVDGLFERTIDIGPCQRN
jgi:hypothetical protein